MDLIIVESPSKAKTISRYLKGKYQVDASADTSATCRRSNSASRPTATMNRGMSIPPGRRRSSSALPKRRSGRTESISQPTPDREGEAISWHLQTVLGLPADGKNRIEFNEISPKAVEHALTCPRTIDYNLVDAQQARRVLDRLVGTSSRRF